MSQKISLSYALPAILLSTLLVTAVIWAWTEPGAAPPGDNVPAPINVGNFDQIKEAGISVGSFISRGGATLARDSGNVGIGTMGPAGKLDVYTISTNAAGVMSRDNGGARIFTVAELGAGGWNPMSSAGDIGIIYSSGAINTGSLIIGQWSNSGRGIKINSSGNVGIGTANPGSYKLYVNGDVAATAFYYTSDINLKTNVEPLSNSLEKILSLQGVSFNWKDSNEPSMGFIAQEVEKIFPEAVSGPGGEKTIDYARLIAPLIEAIKEQQKEIEKLKAIIQ